MLRDKLTKRCEDWGILRCIKYSAARQELGPCQLGSRLTGALVGGSSGGPGLDAPRNLWI